MVDSHKHLASENDSGGGGHCFDEQPKEGSSSGGDLSELNDQSDSITKGPYCYISIQKKDANANKVPVFNHGNKFVKLAQSQSQLLMEKNGPKVGKSLLDYSPAPIMSAKSLLK